MGMCVTKSVANHSVFALVAAADFDTHGFARDLAQPWVLSRQLWSLRSNG